jgi:hypothetical protein
MRTHVFLPVSMLSAMLFTALACGGDDVAGAPNNVAGGSSGASGTAGAGNGGASGMTQAGNGGSSGSSAGASGAGNGGASGTAGTAGQGGSSGSSGTAGVGGMSGSGGGSPVIDPPPVTEQCNTNLVKPAGGTVCEMTKTGNTARVIRGRVVGTDKIYEGGEILVDGQGIIQCLGCDCSQNSAYGAATVVTCAEGVVTPALINTHDHITFAQNSPKVHTAKYDHRHEWRKGLNGKPKISVGSYGSQKDVVSWGELRFVLGGAASTVGSGGIAGMIRNLDRNGMQESGITQKPIFYSTFPLGDSGGSLLTTCTYQPSVSDADVDGYDSFFPHMSEGIALSARNEFLCSNGGTQSQRDYVKPQTAMIHAIGLLPGDAAMMASDGTGVIWSPRSNIDLYGFTAPVTTFARMGVQLALGTDWSASGSMNLLREISCARSYSKNQLGGFFSDYQLYRMVTADAASVSAVGDRLGQLKQGFLGDVTVWKSTATKDVFETVTTAAVADVALVLRAGKVLHGEAALVDGMAANGTQCEALDSCLSGHKVCAQAELGKTVSQLKTALEAAGELYPLFFCDTPTNEPSCVPSRPGGFTGVGTADDTDGDGVPNATDLCPTVFDPIRPIDNGKQGDADNDGVGDACDVCPLVPNSDMCPLVAGDADSDGKPDSMDNCPSIYNPMQEDADMDMKGDACDFCPNDPNPGAQSCPAAKVTIADAKTKPEGSKVEIEGVCVTATRTKAGAQNGMWIQDPNHNPMLAQSGGLFVWFNNTALPAAPGDLVTISGTIEQYSGLLELVTPTSTKTGACPKTLDELTVTIPDPSTIATGGEDANRYLSMLVRVNGVSVVTQNPDAPSDFDEFSVTGNLRIDDYAFDAMDNTYTVGTNFTSITGLLHFSFDNSKILPRSATDLAQ